MSLPPLRARFWRLRESAQDFWRRAEARFKPWLCRRRLRRQAGQLAVRIDARVGFFAQMNWVLMILAHCEAHGLRPRIELTGPFYADAPGEDWLAHFFRIREDRVPRQGAENGALAWCKITDISQLGLSPDYQHEMTLTRAHALWRRYIRLNPEIEAHVESFVAQHFSGRQVLGVHFRGTDKHTEAPRVQYETCIRAVVHHLDAHTEVDAVFLATDETEFVDVFRRALRTHCARVALIVHDDQARSRDGKAIHTQSAAHGANPRGMEALVNCLLLAHCAALIRTASFLSAWSCVFNPALPVVMLNRPYADKLWFPDREIVRHAAHYPVNTT